MSREIRRRVTEARSIQEERFRARPGLYCNADMESKEIKEFCAIDGSGSELLKTAMTKLALSARAYDGTLKSARNTWARRFNTGALTGAFMQRKKDRSLFLLQLQPFSRFSDLVANIFHLHFQPSLAVRQFPDFVGAAGVGAIKIDLCFLGEPDNVCASRIRNHHYLPMKAYRINDSYRRVCGSQARGFPDFDECRCCLLRKGSRCSHQRQ